MVLTETSALSLAAMTGDRVAVLHGPGADEPGPSGRDIDCFVDDLDPRWPLRISDGWRLCQWHQYDLRAWYWVLEQSGEFVALDTTDDPQGFCRDGIHTREFIEVLEDSPRQARAVYLTLKRARKGIVDPAEWRRIGEIAAEDPNRFARMLERLAGGELASLLSPSALAGEVPTDAVLRRANRLRRARRFGSPTRVPWAAWLAARRYVDRLSNLSGLSVLVVGPDGSGKSTLAARLPRAVEDMFRRHASSHWRPGVLPRPGAMLGKPDPDPTRPHVRAAFGRLPSVLLLGYYWVDFAVGGLLRDLPVKARSGLIVRERGWWDLAVDPSRYRMRVAPGLVRWLGTLLPHPDLVIVLSGDAALVHGRKPELERKEVDRQLTAWRSALPGDVPSIRIDVSHSPEDVLDAAVLALARVMESRAISRLDAGWMTLPGRRVRWWLPRGPRSVAGASVSVYQPVTAQARVGWSAARIVAAAGGFRLLPRGPAPPAAVRRALAPHVPPRGTFAVGRANHPGRFLALLFDERATCRGVAKLSVDVGGAHALEAEERSLRRYGEALSGSLIAPRVLHTRPGLLIVEPIEWIPRRTPWVLEEPVARSLGQFFLTERRREDLGWVGPAHGDCAPWNLLRTPTGWVLVDWESAGDAAAFHDVCHYVVQSHALLGRPSGSEVVAGFVGGEGWIGRAIRAYADAAEVPPSAASDGLVRYLHQALTTQTVRTRAERVALDRRRRLLGRLER